MKKLNILLASSILSACTTAQPVIQETKHTQKQIHNVLQEETEDMSDTLTDEEMYALFQQHERTEILKTIHQFLQDINIPEVRESFFYETYDLPLHELVLRVRSIAYIKQIIQDWTQDLQSEDIRKMLDFLEEYARHIDKRIERRKIEEQMLQEYQQTK